jgi:hypothetical protein
MTCCAQEPDNGSKAEQYLDFDLVKLAAPTPNLNTSVQIEQKPVDDACVLVTETDSSPSPLRDLKVLEEKHKWLQRRRSMVRQPNSDDLHPEHGEDNHDCHTSSQSQDIVSRDQKQSPRSLEASFKRRIKLPLKTQAGSRPLPEKGLGKTRAGLVSQDLEGARLVGDLVQVSIAHLPDCHGGSWTGDHQSRRLVENGSPSEQQYSKSRSWTGGAGQQ